jgi:hypothetical protein
LEKKLHGSSGSARHTNIEIMQKTLGVDLNLAGEFGIRFLKKRAFTIFFCSFSIRSLKY